MMEVPLCIPAMLRRAASLYPTTPIVSRLPDKTLHRYTMGDCVRRAGQLALALKRLGVRSGDRVATLAWNHGRHVEIYYAVPSTGAVLHTLNLRLHPDDIVYIANHAEDRVLFVDHTLWPLWEKCRDRVKPEHVVVMGAPGAVPDGTLDYEALLAAEPADSFAFDDIAEGAAAGMCYTSGTTGRPKGVVYSHRSTTLHSLCLGLASTLGMNERDRILPVVPMFHVNAWGVPYGCAMLGTGQIHPGPHLDPASVLDLLQGERATLAAGVPTIWFGILQALDANPGAYDLSALRLMIVGGAAVPEAMIRGFQERHNLVVMQGWGMTETSPIGTVSQLPPDLEGADAATRYAYRAKAGRPTPLVEVRARNENGLVPRDNATMGELEVRGAWVARAYYKPDEPTPAFGADGWFRTGDIVTIEPNGFVTIQDRAKDLVKSGGEWISSVALEGALMGHPDVAEAAVFAVPHARWDERPLAVVVMKAGREFEEEPLKQHLANTFAKWWVPDRIVPIAAIPKTSAGKFRKTALRDEYRSFYVDAGGAS